MESYILGCVIWVSVVMSPRKIVVVLVVGVYRVVIMRCIEVGGPSLSPLC